MPPTTFNSFAFHGVLFSACLLTSVWHFMTKLYNLPFNVIAIFFNGYYSFMSIYGRSFRSLGVFYKGCWVFNWPFCLPLALAAEFTAPTLTIGLLDPIVVFLDS